MICFGFSLRDLASLQGQTSSCEKCDGHILKRATLVQIAQRGVCAIYRMEEKASVPF